MNKKSVIPLTKIVIPPSTSKKINSLLSKGQLVQGPLVKQFEEEFASLCGVEHAVAVSNGTVALQAALLSLGIGKGDEVITTPFTFVASANSILMTGAKPIFVDIHEQTYNIDPGQIEARITKKTKAILVVNLYGLPADYDAINKMAKKHKLMVIEDAAQSVKASIGERCSGNLADIGCFSLYATKNLFSGEGGVITTNDHKVVERLRELRHHGQSESRRYYYNGLGYNFRLTDIAAAIALDQLKLLRKNTEIRRTIASRYNQAFANIKGILIPEVPTDYYHVYHQYSLRILPEYQLSRDEFQQKLLEVGIGSNIYYPEILPTFPQFGSQHSRKFPVAEKVSQEIISIPIHPHLTRGEVDRIIATIFSF